MKYTVNIPDFGQATITRQSSAEEIKDLLQDMSRSLPDIYGKLGNVEEALRALIGYGDSSYSEAESTLIEFESRIDRILEDM